jgi:hypothetical protein
MEIQPLPRQDQDIESQDDGPQPIRPQDDSPQPIDIRMLDRVETTRQCSQNGG